MFKLRRQPNGLPFGPKLKNFEQIVEAKGLLGYHVEVFKKAQEHKLTYQKLYGEKMKTVQMDQIIQDKSAIRSMLDFCQLPYSEADIDRIFATFDGERVELAVKKQAIDEQIKALLAS
jgi:hypothetical protein